MLKLVVCEKPSVAQSISKVLGATKRGDGFLEGGGYIVSWCVGHLVELAQPESYEERYAKWRKEDLPILPHSWKYQVTAATKKQFSVLKKLMSRSDVESLVCATDAGREGELIFRLVYHQCECKKPFERLWISSMEDTAIREGFPSHDIRFINSRYKELFRIPDGGTIQVDYPDRHYAAKCCYIDDYHTQVGNNVYHICQFAEILERGGGTCRPEPELDRDTAAWKLGSQNYLTVERSSSGWTYHLYDQGFQPVAAGEVGGLETSILEARDQAMEQCRLSSRNRELTDYDREKFHRREFMSQDKIEKWDEVNGNMGNNGRLEAFLDSAGDNYAILQLRDIEETRMERFSSLRMLERMDMEVNIDHYEVVYIAPLPIHTNRSTFLESVFEKFNLDHPEDFKGHSLSVSDIVAIRENGAVSCYYCDSICFQELPGLIPENYLKNAEMQLEDDYGMIDGVVNNGAKDRKEKAAKDKAEKPSVVEQLKNQPHCEVRKKSTVKYTEQER